MGIIRLILAIAVVIVHTEPIFGFELVRGRVAVQSFFIISGFYMAMILNEKYIGKNSYKLFITNRFLRLYPIYWTVLLGMVLVCILSKSGAFSMYIQYFDSMSFGSFLFLIFTNIFMFFQEVVMFLGLDTTTGNLFFTKNLWETNPMLHQFLFLSQAWTIGLELLFYLVAPLIARRKVKYVLVLMLCSLLLRVILVYGFNLRYDPWIYRFFPTELLFFLAGIVAYRMYKFYLQRFQIKKNYSTIIWMGLLVFTLIFSFLPSTPDFRYIFLVKDWIYFLVFFISMPFIFSLTKKWKFDRYIGDLSYPVYISHIFILWFCKKLEISALLGGLGVTTTILSILFSIALNEVIQKRVEKIRQKRIS